MWLPFRGHLGESQCSLPCVWLRSPRAHYPLYLQHWWECTFLHLPPDEWALPSWWSCPMTTTRPKQKLLRQTQNGVETSVPRLKHIFLVMGEWSGVKLRKLDTDTVPHRFSHPITRMQSRTIFCLSGLNRAAGLDLLILEPLSDLGRLFQELKLSGSVVC